MYGPDGAISSWRELMTAAVVVRSMLGVSPSANQARKMRPRRWPAFLRGRAYQFCRRMTFR
ncbi:replication initiation protein RepC [Ensifer canadensis]|uniref:replication initiation protein RepC n=1 Tax=Ensifer canadensis TaxID=555315 RepID=UPI003B51EA42